MKLPAVIILMLVLFLGANFYVLRRLWFLIPPVTPVRVAVISLCILCIACCFLYFVVIGRNTPHWLGAAIYGLGMSYIIIFVYLLTAFLLMDLVRVTRLVPMDWMVHGSWTSFAIFAGVITALMVAGNIVYHNKKRVEIDIVTDKLAPGTPPVRILAVSDLHLGYGTGNRELPRWIDMLHAENADIILIGGDLIDTHLKPLYDKGMAEPLRRLSAPLGVYAVPGNHEYISGIEESGKFYAEAGIPLLRDSAVTVGDSLLHIVGRDDRTNASRKSLAALTAPLDRSLPAIVIDHQPTDLSEAAAVGVTLQFSGHTHYGQVWPISWITSAIFEKAHGYTRHADTHYYISSGLGIWGGKFRIGTRSEYVVMTLAPKQT